MPYSYGDTKGGILTRGLCIDKVSTLNPILYYMRGNTSRVTHYVSLTRSSQCLCDDERVVLASNGFTPYIIVIIVRCKAPL